MLFFIIEILLPKQAFKNEAKTLLSQNGTNVNSVFIPSSQAEFKTKALNDSTGINQINQINQLNQLNQLNQISQLSSLGGRTSNIKQNNIDLNLNEGFVKAFFEKFLDHSRGEAKREKLDFLPMLTSSKEEDLISLGLQSGGPNNMPSSPLNSQVINSFSKSNSGLNGINNVIKGSPLHSSCELPRIDIDEPQETLFRNPSPNPFLDDMNYSPNLFASPKHTNNEAFPFFSRNNSDLPQGDKDILCMKHFNPNTSSRNNSMDLNDLFKNSAGTEEEFAKKLLHGEKDYVFDDSYFSVSSDKNRSDAKSDHKLDDL